jgi:hypothetical protein
LDPVRRLENLVFVAGVEHDAYATAPQQLRDSARVLKDAGVAGRLKEMDFRLNDEGLLPSQARTPIGRPTHGSST